MLAHRAYFVVLSHLHSPKSGRWWSLMRSVKCVRPDVLIEYKWYFWHLTCKTSLDLKKSFRIADWEINSNISEASFLATLVSYIKTGGYSGRHR